VLDVRRDGGIDTGVAIFCTRLGTCFFRGWWKVPPMGEWQDHCRIVSGHGGGIGLVAAISSEEPKKTRTTPYVLIFFFCGAVHFLP
jgi:hypothetical protein